MQEKKDDVKCYNENKVMNTKLIVESQCEKNQNNLCTWLIQ